MSTALPPIPSPKPSSKVSRTPRRRARRRVRACSRRFAGRGDKQALERIVGDLASEPLDPNHPLWTVHIVEEYDGGAALVLRGHHAIADGMALMGVTMSLVDGPAHEGRRQEPADEEVGWLRTLMAIGALWQRRPAPTQAHSLNEIPAVVGLVCEAHADR